MEQTYEKTTGRGADRNQEWKIYFNANFWGHQGRDHAGKEIRIDKQFDWAGYHWVIPAAYACGQGLVVDFCMQVAPERIRNFMKKWNLNRENDGSENFARESYLQMEWENPLCFHFEPCLTLNGKLLEATHGCSVCFHPCLPDGIVNELEARWAIDHYGLDSSCGWVICRYAFPWATKRRPEIKTLSLTMTQQPGQLPGPRFQVHGPGDTFSFVHPVSGARYTLTVQEMEQQTIPQDCVASDRWAYPTRCVVMTYTVSPEPVEHITITDCAEGDRPLEAAQSHPAAGNACSVGIIGGADGPTAFVFGTNSLHAACSALHFEPVQEDIQWRMVFHVKQFAEASFPLI